MSGLEIKAMSEFTIELSAMLGELLMRTAMQEMDGQCRTTSGGNSSPKFYGVVNPFSTQIENLVHGVLLKTTWKRRLWHGECHRFMIQ